MPFRIFRKPRRVRVIMLGLDGSGKSSIVHRLDPRQNAQSSATNRHLTKWNAQYEPTIGINRLTLQRKRAELAIWDIGGSTLIRQLWHHYYSQAQALVFVVDSTDIPRIREARYALMQALGPKGGKSTKRVPLLVFANKQDLPGALSVPEIIHKLHLRTLGTSRRWCVVSSSAESCQGLDAGLGWLAKVSA